MTDQLDARTPFEEPLLYPNAEFRKSSSSPATRWEPLYRRLAIGSDALATAVMAMVAGLVSSVRNPAVEFGETLIPQAVTVFVVLASFAASRVWHPAVLGQDAAEELRALGRGVFAALVTMGLGILAIGLTGARLWVFLVVAGIALIAFPQRYLLRQGLHRARREGRCLLPVLAAGSPDAVGHLIARTRDAAYLGWRVDAVCTVDATASGTIHVDDVPVIGEFAEIAKHVEHGGYRIVAVTPDPYWTPQRLQELAWDLEGTGAEMVINPGLMDVSGPRVHVSGVLGMPLLRVSQPAFTGFRRVVKSVADRCGAALLIVLFAPLMAGIAAAIKINSPGKVFYPQRRVGKDGELFTMLKFRTMTDGAHAERSALADANEAAGPLFKIRNDPRVTTVGAKLRRYSLDELPQLFNVLTGSMSLVGPRPPLPEECAQYGHHVFRRFLVKPGLTGLWQVSGRSDLSWDESIRLDLQYVEDWSLALDAVILWKTFNAVIRGQGAY